MFLNKEKLVLLILLLCVSLETIVAQQFNQESTKVLKDHKVLVLNGDITYLPIYKVNRANIVASIIKDTLDKKDFNKVYKEDWSTTVFNTYWRNKQNKRPFSLHFADTVFASPVEHKMVVTSRYGWRRGRPHQGIDIDLKTGDNVRSLLKGKVRYARRHGGHGKTVVIRHDNGLETVYAHLSKYLVKENDIVEKGQIIGKGGVSGNARGSHLHLEVRYHGKSIHPEYLFDFSPGTKIRSDDIVVTKKWITPRSHRSTRQSKIVVQTDIEEITNEIENPTKSIYVVKKGDTLHGIARKHDVQVSEICKINEIRYNSVLNVGQEIVIY
ncbi:Murein DD-endopeptidase MepM and murein hydrolase activator NlpD, contain LysM domain [Aquimarina amphilecti]|uniref:Murein DD-endopeptidase MepM and murein hydrolase activator NlpD, contain LysM domain n=1 Tax=Aquimarina amphilecti TaxID=1038014 RepID=A0A1H7HUY1_AQUAM|nr:M23 family metallopeptidase [Aquimarina amphilecti]SEK52015.1 Murein DD-endopeptidase MepM and murein hydrolase activator NlpD, contain LysM domain [Aquimarina amphilecti]